MLYLLKEIFVAVILCVCMYYILILLMTVSEKRGYSTQNVHSRDCTNTKVNYVVELWVNVPRDRTMICRG